MQSQALLRTLLQLRFSHAPGYLCGMNRGPGAHWVGFLPPEGPPSLFLHAHTAGCACCPRGVQTVRLVQECSSPCPMDTWGLITPLLLLTRWGQSLTAPQTSDGGVCVIPARRRKVKRHWGQIKDDESAMPGSEPCSAGELELASTIARLQSHFLQLPSLSNPCVVWH